ncbi:hypothetical protein BHE74_00023895 [Ensete ventricosum]|nr:hypothetical protein BHE74_00023895 [Ensete ventricosum]
MRLLACGGCRYWRARPPLVRPLLHAVVACPCRCCHSGCGQPLMANPRAAAAYARPTQRPAWAVSSVTAAVSTISTTTTLMLSSLPREMASSANRAAASAAVHPLTASGNILAIRPLRHCLAILHAASLETTSQSPSLANMRNSSFSVLSVTVTSGSEITNGFK